MPEQAFKKRRSVPFLSSLQFKYAVSYLVIFAVVLLLLNTYPVIASQDLIFGSKENSMRSQAAVFSSALMELESLSPEQVERVMNMLDTTGLSHILVTDPAGLVLYDSLRQPSPGQDAQAPPEENESGDIPVEETAEMAAVEAAAPAEAPVYRYALSQEVVLALRGYDNVYSVFRDGLFASSAAMPIVYRGMTIGAIYLYEEDAALGSLLLSLQHNLQIISLVIAAVTLVMSFFFSRLLTTRVGALLRAIRIVGEGEYGHRLQPTGRDEMAQLAEEFNQLTDRLQTTEEVRRRFVSDASHELKTPLASIRLLTDSILQTDGMDRETVREFVSDIGREAERLTRITEHLLTLTRLDSLPPLETEPVDLNDVVDRVLPMLSPLAEARGVALEPDLHPGCVILGAPDELHQVCFNLIENAIKYNVPNGQVWVRTYLDDGQVILEVADTGLGIPEEDRPKVFNRFYRVDKARSRAAGGTGLGLSIVRDAVRRHSGWITVRPNQPQGSVFTAGFPLYQPIQEGGDAP